MTVRSFLRESLPGRIRAFGRGVRAILIFNAKHDVVDFSDLLYFLGLLFLYLGLREWMRGAIGAVGLVLLFTVLRRPRPTAPDGDRERRIG